MLSNTTPSNMTSNKNVFYQLGRYFLCIILLLAALPFITLAGIFSLFAEIPHIKIELGSDNVVESVYFKLTRDWTEEQPAEQHHEDEDDEELIELSTDLSKLLFGEDTNIITTESILHRKIADLLDVEPDVVNPNPIPFNAGLWNVLDVSHDESLTWADLDTKLVDHYHVLGEEEEDAGDSGNDADDEEEEPPSPRIVGRVGGMEEGYPSTPVRSRSPVSPPDAPQKVRSSEHSPIRSEPVEMGQLEELMRTKLTLDSGVITKIRSTTELNDSDLTQDHASSSEKEHGVHPSSESRPAS